MTRFGRLVPSFVWNVVGNPPVPYRVWVNEMNVSGELSVAAKRLEAGDLPGAEDVCRRVLDRDPDNGNALHVLGVVAIRSGNVDLAIDSLEKALAAGASRAAVHNHLGVALASAERFEQSLESLRRAIDLDPRLADAHYNLANVLQSLHQPDEAVAHYRRALEITPHAPQIRFNLANALRDLERPDEAVAEYRQALRLRPTYVKAHNNLGNVLRKQRKLDEAEAALREAIRLRPNYAEGHHNLGLVLGLKGQRAEAIQSHRKALQAKPDFAAARNSLCKTLIDQGELEEAAALLQSMCMGEQATVQTRLKLAERLRSENRLDEALANVESVLKIDSEHALAHHNLGLIYFAKGNLAKSAASYRRALEARPDLAEVHNNLAIVLHLQNDSAAAMDHIETALAIQPDFAVAHLNRAVSWLRMGDFPRGWHEFEWRRLCEGHHIRRFDAPLFDGKPLPEGTVLLHAEQGLGDTIQFVRYAALVKQRCQTVVVQCQDALKPLLSGCTGIDHLVALKETLPECDAQAPLTSLPLILGTTLDTIPHEVPYLAADDRLAEQWRERLGKHRGFKVGIAWQGSSRYNLDDYRSVPLRHFGVLARLADVKLFSLQCGQGSEQLGQIGDAFSVVDFGPDFDKSSGPFMDTAAVMKNLDLVVSSDTSIVHLAGALGVPVWVALSYSPDWRWLETHSDSPWYPTMRLFRQRQLGDWDELFQRVARELSEVAGGNTRKLLPASDSRLPAIHAPISPGELLDKLTIAQIKCRRISDEEKLRNVRHILRQLSAVRDRALRSSTELTALTDELRTVNEKLWEIEDEIRACEKRGDFGPAFVELARAVYDTNDRRAAIKRKIDVRLGSELIEEKSYDAREDLG